MMIDLRQSRGQVVRPQGRSHQGLTPCPRLLSRMAVRLVRAAGLFVVVASTAACNETAGSSGHRLVEQTFASMGTELRLTTWTTDEAGAVDAFKEIIQEFDRLEGLLS